MPGQITWRFRVDYQVQSSRNNCDCIESTSHAAGLARSWSALFSDSRQRTEMGGGVTVKDVDQQQFVKHLAAFLKKSGKLKVPEWVDVVKTAVRKELAPSDPDWFYIRCASTARHLYIRGGVGVKSFTKIYGGRKRRGTRPCHFSRGSQSVARRVLQSLESVKMIQKDELGGRRITYQGQRDMDRIAGQVAAKPAQ